MSSYTPVLQILASNIMPCKEDDTINWKLFIPCLPYKEPSQLSLKSCQCHPRPAWSSALLSTRYEVLAKQAQLKARRQCYFQTYPGCRLLHREVRMKTPLKYQSRHTVAGRETKISTSSPDICLLACEDIILTKTCKLK